ncbi:MAG: alpha/beta hydrolase family protein [Acidimicrobiia bacterium]
MEVTSQDIKFVPEAGFDAVSAILDRSESCRSLLVLGHGSGSNMRVPFIVGLSTALVNAGVATFRYQFPYSESADFIPYSDMDTDSPEVLAATVRSAVGAASDAEPDLPLFVGGHSVSGFTASVADAALPLEDVKGLVVLGFPLKGDPRRATHLEGVSHPILLLQGTDDELGRIVEITEMVAGTTASIDVSFIESANHGFSVPGRDDIDVYEELGSRIAAWIDELI